MGSTTAPFNWKVIHILKDLKDLKDFEGNSSCKGA